jgi:hypothetical protein
MVQIVEALPLSNHFVMNSPVPHNKTIKVDNGGKWGKTIKKMGQKMGII